MVRPRVAVHDNVNISESEDTLHATAEHVHHSLENSRARSETEEHSAVLAQAIGGHNASFRVILFLNSYLVEPVAPFHNREVSFALEGGRNVVRTRKRLLRYHNVLVNFRVISTSPPGP